MAIEIKTDVGAVIKFDTVEEYREFMITNVFVSFPEEEESTSGDEGLTIVDIRVGDYVKFLDDYTDGYGDTVQKGRCSKVIAIQEGDILLGTMPWQSVKHEDIPTVLTKIDEEEFEDEVDGLMEGKPAPKFEVGDKVRVKGADYHSLESGDIGTVTDIAESIRHTHIGRLIPTPYEVTINNNLGQFVAPEHLELIEEVESEDSEIKAGDIVIATGEVFDITEGTEYEIREDLHGDLYFLDDDGDIRFVINHEDRLRKKIIEAIEEPKLEVGSILRCNKDSMYVTEGKLYEVLAIDRDGDAVYMDDGNSVSFVNETDIPERFEIL